MVPPRPRNHSLNTNTCAHLPGATAGDGDSERDRLLPEPTTEVRAPQASVHHADAVRVHVEYPKDF